MKKDADNALIKSKSERQISSVSSIFNSSNAIVGMAAVVAILSITISAVFSTTILTYIDNNFEIAGKAFGQKVIKPNNDESNTSDKITIKLNSIKFSPSSTNKGSNLLKVLVDYHTNDASKVNSPMSGIMKVYLSNGTQVRTSPIANGYVVEKSGTAPFSTSFTDDSIKKVKVTVYLTDPLKLNKISNEVSAMSSLTK